MKKIVILIQTIILISLFNPTRAQNKWQSYTKKDWNMTTRYGDTWWFFDMQRIIEDKEGNIWFGNNRYDGEKWTVEGELDKKSFLFDMLYDSKGNLWMGVYTKGLYRYSNNEWKLYTLDNTFNSKWVQTLFEASDGKIWIGTASGVYVFENEKITKSLSSGRLTTEIIEDKDANIWISSSSGAYKYDGEKWQHFKKPDQIDKDLCYSLTEGPEGNIWVGHFNGRMSIYKDGDWDYERKGIPAFDYITATPGFIIGLLPGFIVGYTVKFKTSMMLHTDSHDNVWLASYFKGVYKNDDGNWTDYKAKGANRVLFRSFKFIEDKQQNVWVISFRGVSKYDGEKWEHYKAKKIMGKSCFVVDGFCDKQGNIWVATSKGVSKYSNQ